jgi:hypothetical protein
MVRHRTNVGKLAQQTAVSLADLLAAQKFVMVSVAEVCRADVAVSW